MKNIAITAEALAARMLLALRQEAAKHIAPSPAANRRSHKCSVSDCDRLAYAKGYCNAHYIRKRSGKTLEGPLASRKRAGKCVECGAPTNKNGGLGRCQKHYRRWRMKMIKQVAVSAFGGRCFRCDIAFPDCVFDFHHLGEKEFAIGSSMEMVGVERLAQEIATCELLCANCHRMEHYHVGF